MTLPLIDLSVCLLGALLWTLAPDTKPKAIEADRLAYFAGLLALLFALGAQGVLRIG